MSIEPGDRLLGALPALYGAADAHGHSLRRLLAVFERLLFDAEGEPALVGAEQLVAALPALFSPAEAPAPFVQWMAAWLGFAPRTHFDDAALRRILPALVELYGRRGTAACLIELLRLCFDELADVEVDDRPPTGFVIGRARVAIDTRLGRSSPFRFTVRATAAAGHTTSPALERRLRAVIDFAKPAHTRYDFSWAAAVAAPAQPRSPSPAPTRHPGDPRHEEDPA